MVRGARQRVRRDGHRKGGEGLDDESKQKGCEPARDKKSTERRDGKREARESREEWSGTSEQNEEGKAVFFAFLSYRSEPLESRHSDRCSYCLPLARTLSKTELASCERNGEMQGAKIQTRR